MSLPVAIRERLNADDDPKLWEEVLRALTEDASVVSPNAERVRLYAVIGSCSHWLRPHQSRWTEGGGFAAPFGYGYGKRFLRGTPDLDWSVTLLFDPEMKDWITLDASSKRLKSVRVAIPSRTNRHRQAAVHSIWPRGTLAAERQATALYGFRKLLDGWKLVARSKTSEERGH